MQDLHLTYHSPVHTFFKQLYGNSTQVLCCYDQQGLIRFCTDAYLNFFGSTSLQDHLEKYYTYNCQAQGLGQDVAKLCREHLDKALAESGHIFPWVHVLPGGEKVQVQYTFSRIEFEGKPFIIAVILGTQNNKQTLENFYYQDKNAQALLEASPIAICLWDNKYTLIDCNKSFIELFGLKNKEEYGLNPHAFYPEMQSNGMPSEEFSVQLLSEAFATGQSNGEWLWRNKTGETVPTRVSLRRVTFNGQEMVAEYIYDLRILRETQRRANQAEIRNQIMLDAMPLSMSFWDKNYNLVDCNAASVKLFGFSSKEEYLAKFNEVSPPSQPNGKPSLKTLHEKFDQALAEGVSHVEWMHKQPDGSPVPVDKICVKANLNGDDMVITFSRDLREIYATKQKAAEAEARNKAVLDAMPLSMSFWDKEYNLIDCNLESISMYGFKNKEEYMQKFREVSPKLQPNGKDSVTELHAKFDEAMLYGISHMEWMHQTPNGAPLPVDKTCVKAKLHDDNVLITFSRDLREIKASQKVAEEAELRNRLMLDSMPLGVHFWDNNLNLIDCNQESLSLYGFTTKEEFKENFSKTYPAVQPNGENSEKLIKRCLEAALSQGYAYTEFLSLTQHDEKSVLPVEIILTRITYKDGYGVICYIRDLRDFKAMLAEIKEVENDLRTAKNIAEKNAAAKSEFLANMSHEIRTPMNGILGLLHLLDKTTLQNEQKSYVEKSLTSANNLLRIINDILDFSALESGKFQFVHAPFSMEEICKDICEIYETQIQQKGLQFHVHMPLGATKLMGDALRLKQVFSNLLDNALKFTSEGSISLHIEEKPAQTEKQKLFMFSVHDTGIGLSPEHVKHIFSAFSQVDSSFTRAYGGTGLGLVISQNILQMMHGDIWVESELNKGSTFFCSAIFDVLEEATQQDEQGQALPQSSGHLLLVEDNIINQMVATEILQHAGYSVDVANNGQEALDMLDETNYDLVLMDIQMPIMDGLTATRKIREQEKFTHLPIVALSAHALEEDKQKSFDSGMNEHTTKPIVPEELYKTIEYWIRNAALTA